MTSQLDIHVASPAEQVAAHTNVFEFWGKGRSLEEHLRVRQTAPMHRRATWIVGCIDGRVVTSLASYPVRFRASGQEVPGIAIGSVYTLGEFRGRGFAPRLLAWTEQYEQARQAAWSVLYSDIDPRYYARIGYVPCPSLEGWRDPREPAPASSTAHRLVEISHREIRPAFAKLYADFHGRAPLSIARDADYWTEILAKSPEDRFFGLEPEHGNWTGYVRIAVKGDAWRIVDFALAEESEYLLQALYAATVVAAQAGGTARVGGWLPDEAVARRWFKIAPRRTEITMIKPLAASPPPDDAWVTAAGRFWEIDHV